MSGSRRRALPGCRIARPFLPARCRGVAADVRHVDLALPTRAQIFVHSMQSDLNWPWLVLAVRAAPAPAALADRVRAILREVNPNVPITRINDADEVVARSIMEPR